MKLVSIDICKGLLNPDDERSFTFTTDVFESVTLRGSVVFWNLKCNDFTVKAEFKNTDYAKVFYEYFQASLKEAS